MLLTKNIMVKWNAFTKRWYESKGYVYTKMGDEFKVKVEDLTEGSHDVIKIICDYCFEDKIYTIIEKEYKTFINSNKKSIIHKDCCIKCRKLKTIESLEFTYGVSHNSKLVATVEKRKQTNLIKYGFENYSQTQECKDRIKQTNLLNFGVEYSMQNPEIREKSKLTSLLKYGVESYTKTDEYKIKSKETSLKNWGTTSPMKSKKVRDKVNATNVKRYGFKSASSNQLIKDKVQKTVQEKWGVDYIGQNKDIKNKIKETNNNRFGVNFYFQTDEFKDQYKSTMMAKYGVDNSFKSEEVKAKIKESLYKNGTAPCSLQQYYICNLVHGELNYPVGNCSLDIGFPEEKLYIEYDGSGHNLSVIHNIETIEVFENRNRRRWYYLNYRNWKSIQIISLQDKLPLDIKILEMIEYAKKYISTGHSWIKFDIDNSKIINSQGEINYDFGDLRKIRPNKELIEEVI